MAAIFLLKHFQASSENRSKFVVRKTFNASNFSNFASDFDWISWANNVQHSIMLTSNTKSCNVQARLTGNSMVMKYALSAVSICWQYIDWRFYAGVEKFLQSFLFIQKLEKLEHFSNSIAGMLFPSEQFQKPLRKCLNCDSLKIYSIHDWSCCIAWPGSASSAWQFATNVTKVYAISMFFRRFSTEWN